MINILKEGFFKSGKTKRLLLLLISFSFCLLQATAGINFNAQQPVLIQGTVKDNTTGEALPGAIVQIEGTKNATLTDFDGNFSLKVSDKKAVLVFSFIGYVSQKITIGNQTNLKVSLVSDVKNIEEVVVVGFGQQKKANVTGAISTVDSKAMVATPVASITSALIGNAPGISGVQSSGEPGRNAATIFIRGRSTYNGSGASPLIVIDGVEQAAEQPYAQLNSMDANEIASVSILKDAASTAVYGIRGANGVIVVTTKRGTKSKQSISLSTNYGFTEATGLMHGVNSYDYAVIRNEAINYNKNQFGDNSFNSYLFSDDELWKFQNNRDYTPAEVAAMSNLTDAQKAQLNESPALWYRSTDFMQQQFGNKGPQAQVNLNIKGGTDKMQYFTSIGYFNQGSILDNTNFEGSNTGSHFNRYNFRSSFDFHPTKNLDISFTTAGQFGTTAGPSANTSLTDDNARYKAIFINIQEGYPFMPPGIIDGKLVDRWAGTAGSSRNPLGLRVTGAQSPVGMLLQSGQGIIYNTLLSNILKVNHRLDYLTKGLSVRGTFGYDDNYRKMVLSNPSIPNYSVTRNIADPNILDFYGGVKTQTALNTSANNSSWNKTYFDAGIDYVTSIGNHNITALLLGKASIYKMPGSFNTPSGIMGIVGRVTYNYNERYMAEFDLGYNGTEQFAKGSRFGYFPAYSAGWVPTNERFFPKTKWIDFLKIRGSYGTVGSDNLGGRRYLYLPSSYVLNAGGSAYYPGTSTGTAVNPAYRGAYEGAVGNPFVTWEKATKIGAGLESRFLQNRLSFTLDLFKEDRNNILTTSAIIPATYGVASNNIPPVNVGITTNHGYETTLEWTDNRKEFKYSVSGAVSYARNKIVYKAEAANPYYWQNSTGYAIGQYKGLISDGFFNTPEELANRPYNTFSSNKNMLGDIRYKDINGDGKIDEKDRVPIGYSNLPEYAFNLKFDMSFKGFDFSILFNGTAHGSFYLNSGYDYMFFKQSGTPWTWQAEGRWTPEKVANGAPITYPRAQIDVAGSNFVTSDFWLRSSDFIKLKNLEIGYSIPTTLLKSANIGISSVRIYANGNNVYTFKNALTKYGFDPESADPNTAYVFPFTRAFVFGANIVF